MSKTKTELYVDASFSEYRKHAGYGAVLIRNGRKTEFSGEIQGARNSTEAEIFGVALALEFLNSTEPITLYNDNVACVNVVNGRRPENRHSKMLNAVARIRKFKGSVRAKWVKGHHVSEENCRADELAKSVMFSSEEIEYVKNELNIYIGTATKDKRIGYAYIIEDRFGTRLFSGHETIKNGGTGSFTYVVSKILGKPFNKIDKITHLNLYSNEKNILSYFNKVQRMKKKKYVKMIGSKNEDGLYQALKQVKMRIFKFAENNQMDKVITNANYALES